VPSSSRKRLFGPAARRNAKENAGNAALTQISQRRDDRLAGRLSRVIFALF
jgi:hypothetical protein